MKKLVALAILGVAIKLFLDSEKGHEVKRKAKGMWRKAEGKLADGVDRGLDKVGDAAAKVDNILPSGNVPG